MAEVSSTTRNWIIAAVVAIVVVIIGAMVWGDGDMAPPEGTSTEEPAADTEAPAEPEPEQPAQ